MAKFKARARTVDMLGRQQIANVSTAISELFKNAHDAYADHAEVDYFRSDNLLVIRDNGVGMTPRDFEDRWLVLGTESKYAPQGQKAETYRPPDKLERAIMGEKGIGRLAIALLGRQVLILTRAERDGVTNDLVMCFIHWELFEIPGVNLEDIDIPIKIISGGHLPTYDDVEALLQSTKRCIEKIFPGSQEESHKRIVDDISNFQLDPAEMDEFLGGLSLKDGRSGTHFYVAPADEGIPHEIERDRQEETRNFTKFLLGFSNAVFRETPPPPIQTAFRYWQTDSANEDLIGEGEFFTAQELDSADHKISGQVDEYGQFFGDVRIYREQISGHVISWAGGNGQQTRCGPFEIEFGYVSGAQRETSLPPDEWKRITDKLNRIGGVYVYRDRIRILPYGNSDVDWLNIEERRTKSASYYFFSHRRIFGAVKLTRRSNSLLREKAGREGFQQDKAYRQLKDILENIFLQLAADFFRESGDYSDHYNEQRSELERLELARRRREKQVSTKRKNIAVSLEGFFERVGAGLPEAELANLREVIRQRMGSAARMKDPDEASSALLDAEREANRRLSDIRESYRLVKPRGVGLSRTLQRDWNAYSAEAERLNKEVFDPFSIEVAQTLGAVAREAKLYVDQRKRLSELIRQQAESEKRLVTREAVQVRTSANDTRSAALKFARDAIREMQETILGVEVEFAHRDLAGLSESEVERLRNNFGGRIESVGKKNQETLSKVRDMLTAISSNIAHGLEISDTDIVEAMDQELQELREQSDSDAEMVQLGLAVAVINHEFEAAIKGVRRSLRELRPWAASNEELAGLYQDIRSNFDHLDGHLNLFTPLQRRLYRKAIPIKGSDISHYLHTLFEVRMKRHGVEIQATENFLNAEIMTFPSTIYPVFVNIIDNSIFWLKQNKGSKEITLDVSERGFLVSNNGPAIGAADHHSIFLQGFTRKPGGRGLGLFISKKALQKEGMDIETVPGIGSHGVTMEIKWPQDDDAT
ncbi:ATP-binding protein [Lysobacter maris]|uniref:ATP-binding protein n=1 Tax=Marilutibacter maris TaxID=1605891 RepID=A0A508ASG0_9GAMM|nr:ATP-binding protein [Lysobacter maris]KAB8185249.1 ATP-binding protein [Lysobacter maris]